MPYSRLMQTVVETPAYLRSAKDAKMSDEERETIVTLIAENPEAGEIMPGCGGARKLRFAKAGKGKSGGYRVVTYYAGADSPAFLLTVFSKGEKANLTKAERNALAEFTKSLTGSIA